jgi:hypothetical protein
VGEATAAEEEERRRAEGLRLEMAHRETTARKHGAAFGAGAATLCANDGAVMDWMFKKKEKRPASRKTIRL